MAESYNLPSLLDIFGALVKRIPALFGVVQQRGSEKAELKKVCARRRMTPLCLAGRGVQNLVHL